MSSKSYRMWNGNVRDAALSILMAIEKNQAYSNLLLHQTIEKYDIEPKDRGLLTEITYGTLQHKMTLDYYLQPFIKGKLDDWVRQLLRLSLYQIHYLDRIPNHAAVNEAVEIAKKRSHKGTAGLVNGILRGILRQGVRATEEIADPLERLSIEASHPLWLIERWVKQFGFEQAQTMAFENNIPPAHTVRVNTTRISVEEAIDMLLDEGIVAHQSEVIPECLHIEKGQVAKTKAYQYGAVSIQDESSMIPTYALQIEPGQRVLDMCAAPGGKSMHIAEKLNSQGSLVSVDLHPHKVKLIADQATRLGFNNIETRTWDSRELTNEYDEQSFDRILVDAPCSGLGVIRRKPDIKYTKKQEDFASLHNIQIRLLDEAYKLIKPNGLIVYSTCTIDEVENNGTVQAFLANHEDMMLEKLDNVLPEAYHHLTSNGMIHIFPQDFNSDGFFVAAFRKKEFPSTE
ncbi:16S rRNA (cytosine(967)-C(5))-methyltransferase RsmB [Paenisporosarcina quisquiliarum]|uniref:16S rRNA (cytosine(967)-C(5))-methyltransferase n=1 Tax=Paenisporosarcina quisquiliarum TaxID=365346 RepID=A0A9X3RCS7_9BACL|nr:16S rRNA (cytosine(967)-C(5))-methyltransferase RsmB [Paenisporosarcina quisquiliarum]MCZ8535592.1 16S rRNA (cytosine(967)-C(5))-methyltransferase RsmB [Paenisporosarcina quisquiliarum]